MYRCIKEFSVDNYDNESEIMYIDIGSLWERDDSCNYIGGDVHLESDGAWIEINYGDLDRYFEEVV